LYTGEKIPLPKFVSLADKADGMVHLCEQSALVFGADRRTPVKYRPVVAIRSDGPQTVLLPCTTKLPDRADQFFQLHSNRVMWTQKNEGGDSYAYYRYEVVPRGSLHAKIGIMVQSARIELLQWLKSRF
jgi:hypothetical protein